MVICKSHKFIFLRLPKNASTSLATWFVKNCCTAEDSFTQINDSGIKNTNINSNVIKKYSKHYHFIHMTLQELLDEKLITQEEAFSFHIISVFRNPYHRQLSLFFFLNGDKNPDRFRMMFKNGCHETDPSNKITQSDYLKINGIMHTNCDIWKYDNIDLHLQEFINNYKIDERFKLETYKSNKRPNDIKELENLYYDDATREAVYRYYREDFELLGL